MLPTNLESNHLIYKTIQLSMNYNFYQTFLCIAFILRAYKGTTLSNLLTILPSSLLSFMSPIEKKFNETINSFTNGFNILQLLTFGTMMSSYDR